MTDESTRGEDGARPAPHDQMNLVNAEGPLDDTGAVSPSGADTTTSVNTFDPSKAVSAASPWHAVGDVVGLESTAGIGHAPDADEMEGPGSSGMSGNGKMTGIGDAGGASASPSFATDPGHADVSASPHRPDADIESGLARLDPLTLRPRPSSVVIGLVLAGVLLAAAGVVWWLGVRTLDGQSYDDIVAVKFASAWPAWVALVVKVFTNSTLVIIVSLAFGGIAVAVVLLRKRWWMLAQIAVFSGLAFAATLLKMVLPRPYLIDTESSHLNSAPSGHTILAAAAGVVLLCAVPRVWRAFVAVVAVTYTVVVGLSVIAGGWHRPTDVVMSVLIVGGLALLVLTGTRASGMDATGKRGSSASIQIVGSVLITGGLLACLYGAYVIWQLQPGLSLSQQWTYDSARVSSIVTIIGVAMLSYGLVLVMRQLTAAPLSKIGLIGAPPTPPRR